MSDLSPSLYSLEYRLRLGLLTWTLDFGTGLWNWTLELDFGLRTLNSDFDLDCDNEAANFIIL